MISSVTSLESANICFFFLGLVRELQNTDSVIPICVTNFMKAT